MRRAQTASPAAEPLRAARAAVRRWFLPSILACLALRAYARIVRPWHLRWGATPEECRQRMPGDELITDPGLVATRAITIDAPPAAVWPWLVQMGYRRAGWYSYDRFDNDGVHVRQIIPELQHIAVGDTFLTGPGGGFRVEAFEPDRSLVLMIRGTAMGFDGDISSSISLAPCDRRGTRLVIRVRADFHGIRARLFGLAFDPGDFLMMRRQLLGIRERAETTSRLGP